MKDKNYRSVLTDEVVSCYRLGKQIIKSRLKEMEREGESININFTLPKSEIIEIGYNYLNDNSSYIEI